MMLFILSMSCFIILVHAKEYINETKGCIDINIPRGDKQRLSYHFANSNLSCIAVRDDVFQCAFHCTNFSYFVYYMSLCLCITSINNYPVTDNTGYVTTCQDDSVFCSSGFGIPLYKYQPDMKSVRSSIYEYSYHCVSEKDGYNFDDNCYSGSYYFKCNEKDIIGLHTNWNNAVKYCTSLKTTLSKSVGYLSESVWSRYFRYKSLSHESGSYNERRKCVAVFINSNKRSNSDSIKWSHYQYRNCSEMFPFICVGDMIMNFNITSVTRVHININVTDISTRQFPSNSSEKIDIGVIAIVIMVLSTLSLVVIVLFFIRKCLTVQVCQTTSENIRRNKINIHQMVEKYGNCDIENGNEHRAVHDGYSDPWEIRHNIVQQGELQQQNTTMEEMET